MGFTEVGEDAEKAVGCVSWILSHARFYIVFSLIGGMSLKAKALQV